MSEAPLPSYRDRTALVLGASGFIGRWVARKLVEAGARLVGAARDAQAARTALVSTGVEVADLVEVDLAHPAAIGAVLDAIRPAIVFNLVGYGVDRSERDEAAAHLLNTELVDRLVRELPARKDADWTGAEVVHVGSALEYGMIGGDLHESSMPLPTTLYGRTKLAGTARLLARSTELGVRALTARLFTVYGPGEHPGRLLPTLLDAARSRTAVELSAGLQQRDFIYVEDVAQTLVELGRHPWPRAGIVNLATGRLTTVREFVERSAGVLGIPEASLHFGEVPTRAEEMEHDPVNVERLGGLLPDVSWCTIEAGVRRTRDLTAEDG